MTTRINLSQAKALKFKKHDLHYNRLMAQDTESKVIYSDDLHPDIEVDYTNIEQVGKMVYIKATFLETNTPAYMVIE